MSPSALLLSSRGGSSHAMPFLVGSGTSLNDVVISDRAIFHGEAFHIEREGDRVCLSHPQWSLIGIGRSVSEARSNLLTESLALARVMANDNEADLSHAARRMRTFVMSIR